MVTGRVKRLRHLRLILGDDASGTHEYTDAEVLAGSSGYGDEALARLGDEVRGVRAIMQGRIEVGRWARTSAGTVGVRGPGG